MKSSPYFFKYIGCLLLFVINVYSQLSISITPSSLTVITGEKAEFECNVNEVPPASWLWLRDENQIIASEQNMWTGDRYTVTVTNGRKTSTLTLLKATLEDNASMFHCHLAISTHPATLTVIKGSKLDSMYPTCSADTSKVNTDKEVYLKCSATGGDPKPNLQWYKNGKRVFGKDDFFNDDSSSYFDEYKHNLTEEDEGLIFICKAEGLAVGGNQTCQVQLNVTPSVRVSSNATSFTTGDSIEFTCLAMTPWNISDYIWTVNDRSLAESESDYEFKDAKTTLIINELKPSSSGAEVKCKVITSTGLSGTDSLKLSLIDESNVLLIVYIVIGILVVIILICICILILARHRRTLDKTSFNKTRVSEDRENRLNSIKDTIVHGVPLDNPTFVAEEDVSEYQNSEEYFNRPHIKIDHDYEINLNLNDEEDDGVETYVNSGSVASMDGSFCSFNSFEENRKSVNINRLYKHSLKDEEKVSIQTKALQDFGDLYAKPMKKTNTDSSSIDGLINSRELYAKPDKSYKNKSIHHSLENILYDEKHTYDNRSESIDDLYSKPQKKRQVSQSDYLAELYAQPDKERRALKPKPITTLPYKSSPSSNVIEQDFTYSSIA